MDWMQFLILFLTIVMFLVSLWIILREIQKESKEFHGRLCTLEERYFQMIQKILEKK